MLLAASQHAARMSAVGTKRWCLIRGDERFYDIASCIRFRSAAKTSTLLAAMKPVRVPCGSFRVAPFICYDLRFPEIFRHQTRLGAQVLVVIANWPAPRDTHWQTLLCARAIENQAYVIGVNRVGDDPNLTYAGHSLILDPRGETLAIAGESPQLIQANLQLETLTEYRQEFPVLRDLRPEYFRPI